MEKIKDPAMLLSIANSIGLVGITAYFYKQIEAQRLDLMKLSHSLTVMAQKMTATEKEDQGRKEALHALNNQIREINQNLENVPTFDFTENMDYDLNEIIEALNEAGINVDRPSQVVRSRRGGDRRRQTRRMNDDDDDDRQSTYSRRNTTRTPNSYSTRDEQRGGIRNNRNRDIRQEQNNYEDDSDIINQVRQQQTALYPQR
jgi:cell fate (sporulation/competence/biofilm development) regulator YmcA (YheA/YmcA/DUF963 family)